MMDIEKLIVDIESIGANKKLSAWVRSVSMDAATALSTLQAENEKLRVEAEGMRSNWYKSVEEIKKLRAELEKVMRERDAARSDIETALAYGMKDCELCKNSQCYVRGGTKPCLPKWRGQKED